ncbi:MAG TPA: rhodanese-like domain-containing protein [Gaiellaceae bacterium]|jgi:rhodanese-related sulfurtransferase|nr:rhodanese-like domain-containing protein [Gaiellaceae bacterium]
MVEADGQAGPSKTRRTVADLVAAAREKIEPRLTPEAAREAASRGALLVDLRSEEDRRGEGVIPGSLHIPLSVLHWRVDPESGYANPHVGGLDRQLVVFCSDGLASSLAAASLRELGCERATDLVGGYRAWRTAGLPVATPNEARSSTPAGGLPGMGPPDPGGDTSPG